MKKKVTAMILALALSAGVVAPVPAYADGITVEETSMDTATEKSFDTDYTVKWDADKVYWNKVTLDQQGILRIHLNEEDPKSLESSTQKFKSKKLYIVLIKYVAPILLLLILFSSVLNALGIITL